MERVRCPVIPAKAGIQWTPWVTRGLFWIPAFAGITAWAK